MRGSLTQLQVVYALLLRETRTRFGKNQLGYLWALLQPILWIGTFVAFHHAIGRLTPPGMSLVAFLTTGIVPFSLFRDPTQRCISAIESNRGLLFYPQVRPLDLVIARASLEVLTQLVVMLILLGGLAVWEGLPRVNDLMETVLGLGLAAGLGASMGLVCCCLSVFSPQVERLFPTLLRAAFWFSAIFHPLASVPGPMRQLMLLNPVVHAIELTRDGWFQGYGARNIDPWYPAFWILGLSYFGLVLERMARRAELR